MDTSRYDLKDKITGDILPPDLAEALVAYWLIEADISDSRNEVEELKKFIDNHKYNNKVVD